MVMMPLIMGVGMIVGMTMIMGLSVAVRVVAMLAMSAGYRDLVGSAAA